MTHQFNTREAVHDVAEGRAHLDRGELERLDAAMAGIPLHNLPSALISPTMIVSAVIRQFREKVEVVIQGYHYMNSEQFADLFRVLHEMNESLRKTCDDILQTVEKIQSEEKNT